MRKGIANIIWTFILSLALLMQIPAGAVWAQEEVPGTEAAESETVPETALETETALQAAEAVDESEIYTETSAEETPAESETTVSESETETAVSETETAETEQETESAAETESETETETETSDTISRITGFGMISDKEGTLSFSTDDKPSAEELKAYMPRTLAVHLDDSSDLQQIEVTWEGPADYEDSHYFFYRFTPVWDETRYSLDTDQELPCIWVTFSGTLLEAPVTDSSNEAKVYKYLVSNLHFSKAAALGIMANVEAESDFDPGLIEAGNNIGYGLLQWSFDRRTDLEKYLSKNGYAPDSIEGQLQFMWAELNQNYYKHILTKLKSVPNNAEGAYEAAYYFCKYYEVPADTEGQSVARGAWARDRYWPMYSGLQAVVDQSITISGHTTPDDTLSIGEPFSIRGVISSPTNLTSVTVGVYNTAGTRVIGRAVTPKAKSYNLRNVDTLIKFGTLKAGIYRYKVIATDGKGTSTLVNKIFTVLSDAQTVTPGTYNIVTRDNTGYGLYVGGCSTSNGANIYLGKTAAMTKFMEFKLIYINDGYYAVKNVGSGKYLTVQGQSSKSGTNVYQHYTGTLWQILPDSKGGYYFVPKCAPGCCLYVQNGKVALKQNVQIYSSRMAALQSFKVLQPASAKKATISGRNLPSVLNEGDRFNIRGTISSNTPLTSVTVSVLNSTGTQIVGKSVQPNTKTYDLKKIDAQISFGDIPAGVYVYRIYAKNTGGTATLANKSFVVLGDSRTVKDGTYNIVLKTNTKFGIRVQGSSNAEFANIQLWTLNAANKYFQYKVSYQGNGYYKIQNVGSGKYVGVEGQSAKAGSNVRQSAAGTLFQILSDGAAYRFVPKCAPACALNMTGGTAKNGNNIRIFGHDNVARQRFAFKSVTSSTGKATISGATFPSDMYAGTPFSIRGVISSPTNITKVTVGVYTSAGANAIGRTVNPNTKTYDIREVDTQIKFGTLSRGDYIYRVVATNSAGTVTLVSTNFKVK